MANIINFPVCNWSDKNLVPA